MTALTDRERFLAALKNNEDDLPTRLAFADWLDERGEHEEADRQRRWPAAKQWIKALCDKQLPTEEERQKHGDDSFEYSMSIYVPYEQLMEMASQAFANEETVLKKLLYLGLGPSEWLCDDLREHAQLFWENWSIVTGNRVDLNQVEVCFGCGC